MLTDIVRQKYYSDIPENDFWKIVRADPTSLQGKRIGKYSKWLFRIYRDMVESVLKKRFVKEDLTKATEYLKDFDRYKNRLSMSQRDINSYDSLSDLYLAIKSFRDTEKPITSRDIKSGAEKVYEDERWLVLIPHTKEASCLYGANTQWCTAARKDNIFDEYARSGNLYINIDKKNNRKYQFHFESNQFMDETDDRIKSPILSTIGATGKLVDFYKKCRDDFDVLRISSKYQFIGNIKEYSYTRVKLNGKYGFIDENGREIIPCIYDWIDDEQSLCDDNCRIVLNGKYGFIDKNGKEVIPCNYDGASIFNEGLAAIKLNGKWGFIDRDGIEVIPHRYEEVYAFREGFVAIKLNGKWGFIDKSGREVIPCKYDGTYCFTGGLGSVRLQDKFGFVNKEGIEAIPCKYNAVADFVNGIACVELNGGWGLIDNAGREVTSFNYTLPEIIQKRKLISGMDLPMLHLC